ncbi:MAG: NUDIX hydrolase [Myxococcota bacterium]|jgi:ADP-ribose pyrophosphatase YjhB (NUDIX family)|nr:NUDIX hydrolase [Myxococcota bacterium]
MPLTERFCHQCGKDVFTRRVEGRPRQVCVSCGTVFYKNPLPVAAAVVLDSERRVLLIKRKHEPHRGMWCLPIGFAELNETIAEAAIRELAEETAITGRVVRLLGAESTATEPYGDLLVVTFEVAKVAGQECAGDDAEDIAYFDTGALPPLAFTPNQTAIAACVSLHRAEWAIRDSFSELQSGSGHDMLSDALVLIIEEHADSIAALWAEEVHTNPSTTSYRKVEAGTLEKTAATALRQLSRWLVGKEAVDEIHEFYRCVGKERKDQGIELPALVSSLTLLRKHIWKFGRESGIVDNLLEVYRVMEFDRRVVMFFDKAMYQAVRGYLAA